MAAVLMGVAALGGCAGMQAAEPVLHPPQQYRFGTTVPVEFVHPSRVGLRCAERGAKFMGLPGVNAGACADVDLITMPNPCYTVGGGWYARVLCHELAHANGWAANHAGGTLFATPSIPPASQSPRALELAQAAALRAQATAAAAAVEAPVSAPAAFPPSPTADATRAGATRPTRSAVPVSIVARPARAAFEQPSSGR